MVATRRVFRAAAFRALPVVVLNHGHAPEDAPVEYDSATEAYCLRPLVARGPAQSEFPVRCVVARRYPAPFAVFVDPGRGAYSHREEFEDRPSPADVTRAIRAALES